MRAFEADLLHRWIYEFLESSYPGETGKLGRPVAWDFVCTWVKRARVHGYSTPGQVRRFVNLAFLLGPDFEHDPDMGWARRTLTDPQHRDGAARLAALELAAIRHLLRVQAGAGEVSEEE